MLSDTHGGGKTERESGFIFGGVLLFVGFFMLVGVDIEFMTYISVAIVMAGALVLMYYVLNDIPAERKGPKGP